MYFSLHLQISAVRLPREPSNPERLKGFGYAEFDDVDSLLGALNLNEEVSRCDSC
jgi:translation initiation factor 4B